MPAPPRTPVEAERRYALFNELCSNARGEMHNAKRPDLALPLYEAALALYDPPEAFPELTVKVVRELISIFSWLKFHNRAHRFAALLRRMEGTLEQLPDTACKACYNRARLAIHLGDYAAAERELQRAGDGITQDHAERRAKADELWDRCDWHRQFAHLHEAAGHPVAAFTAANRARRCVLRQKESKKRTEKLRKRTFDCLRLLQACGRHGLALPVFAGLITDTSSDGEYFAYAVTLAALGRDREALPLAQKAVAHLEGQRVRLRLGEVERGVVEGLYARYDLVAQLLARNEATPEELLNAIAAGKARLFNRQLLGPAAAIAESAPEEAPKWRPQLAVNLAATEVLLREEGNDAANYVAALAHRVAEMLDERLGRGIALPSPPLAELQAAIPSDTLVVELFQLHDELLVFALTRAGAQYHRVPLTLKQVRDTVAALGGIVRAMSPDSSTLLREMFYWQAEPLGRAIFAPLQELLAGHSRLLLCPHRALHRLPFALLRSAEGKLLGETHVIGYLPSLAALQRQVPAAAGTRALIISNCTGELRHATAEGKAIAALFPGSLHLDDGAATHAAVTAALGGVDIIHIASHNRFDPHGIVHTHIPLADESLTTAVISRCALARAPLVVLSACDSGLAEERHSDELDSFAHSFLLAGARAVVVTLWPIDDAHTPALMRDFYACWQQSGDAVAALAAVQRAAHANGLPPHLFGAFKNIN